MTCDHCGHRHILRSQCPVFLHDSVFMKACVGCRREIESGAERVADGFGNIYHDDRCRELGYRLLFEVAQRDSAPIDPSEVPA